MNKVKNRALRLAKKVEKRAKAVEQAAAEADAFIATFITRSDKQVPAWFLSNDIRKAAELLRSMTLHLIARIESEKEHGKPYVGNFSTSSNEPPRGNSKSPQDLGREGS